MMQKWPSMLQRIEFPSLLTKEKLAAGMMVRCFTFLQDLQMPLGKLPQKDF